MHLYQNIKAYHTSVIIVNIPYAVSKALNKIRLAFQSVHILYLADHFSFLLFDVCRPVPDDMIKLLIHQDRYYLYSAVSYLAEEILLEAVDPAEASSADKFVLVPVFPKRFV